MALLVGQWYVGQDRLNGCAYEVLGLVGSLC
jgi:hypothetical protein